VNDLKRELRSLLETKARDADVAPRLAPRVLKRARRRQRVTVLTAIIGAMVILAGSIAGFRALERIGGTQLPADVPPLPDAPSGFSSVVLPYGSIAYPDGWTVLAFKGDREILQVTNFDSEFDTSCFAADGQALPPLGAVLLIQRLPAEDLSLPTWPVVLSEPGPSAPDCRGAQEGDFGEPEQLQATWRGGSATFVANAALGRLAPQEVRRLLFESFGSLHVIGGDASQTEELLGERDVILDAFDSPAGPVTLYGYRDDSEGGTSWIGSAGPAGTHLSGAGSIGGEVPRADESVTMSLDSWGGVVWGDVAATVARAELRTVEGATYPATLVPLPPGLEAEGHQAVWGVATRATGDRVTTLLYDAEGDLLGDYVPLGRTTVATGEDPEGGPWELYLEVTTDGTGLGFRFLQGGAGGGCCLRPLRGDFRLEGLNQARESPAPSRPSHPMPSRRWCSRRRVARRSRGPSSRSPIPSLASRRSRSSSYRGRSPSEASSSHTTTPARSWPGSRSAITGSRRARPLRSTRSGSCSGRLATPSACGPRTTRTRWRRSRWTRRGRRSLRSRRTRPVPESPFPAKSASAGSSVPAAPSSPAYRDGPSRSSRRRHLPTA
jgi:hypothetical protein